jgi:hypothetical protein
MRSCKKKEIVLLLPDVDQSIAPDQIKFFALVYACFTMSVSLLTWAGRGNHADQCGDNGLDTLCCSAALPRLCAVY